MVTTTPTTPATPSALELAAIMASAVLAAFPGGIAASGLVNAGVALANNFINRKHDDVVTIDTLDALADRVQGKLDNFVDNVGKSS
jgi:hypothetical protein